MAKEEEEGIDETERRRVENNFFFAPKALSCPLQLYSHLLSVFVN